MSLEGRAAGLRRSRSAESGSCRFGEQRDAACGPGHLAPAIARSGGVPGPRGCSCRAWEVRGGRAARGPAAVGSSCPGLYPACSQPEAGRGVHCPARAPMRSQPPLLLLRSARARSSNKFWGTPRRLFFNCPTATHLPPAGWRLAPPSHPPLPSPRPLPLFPTTPPPRGADTPRGGAWARRSRAQPLSLHEPGGAGGRGSGGAATRPAAAGNSDRGRWNLRGEAAAAGSEPSGPGR